MNEQVKIEAMWQKFIKENPNPNYIEFCSYVSNSLHCSLQEAKDMSHHLLLLEQKSIDFDGNINYINNSE